MRIVSLEDKSTHRLDDDKIVSSDRYRSTSQHIGMISLLGLILIAIAGCKPNFEKMLDEGALDGIEGEVLRLLYENKAHVETLIPPERWPDSVYALDPDRVRVDPLGAYIVLWRFFFREEGVFVPRPNVPLKYTEDTDPQIYNLYGSVFAYKRKEDS